MKAIGEGLACPLESFDVSLDEHIDSALLECRHMPAGTARWTTIPLDVGAGAAAGVCCACARLGTPTSSRIVPASDAPSVIRRARSQLTTDFHYSRQTSIGSSVGG